MGVKDQLHISLSLSLLCSPGKPPGPHRFKGWVDIFLTDQEGQWCKGKFTKKDVCKRDTMSQ